ncbi:MAG: ribosome biogenesis GTP-binding protein YihA/YsxC [bacterium]
MKIKTAKFVKSAVKPSQYPHEALPEIAFIGRSNVGKSSLINSLVNRKKMAQTSSTPGRTRMVNFFCINDTFMLVDLPGYGYAKVPQKMKQGWGKIIEGYLKTRKNLKAVIHILDSRHLPTQDDLLMREWLLYYKIVTITVATKVDKLSKTKIPQHIKKIKDNFKLSNDELLLPYSVISKQGHKELWTAINEIVNVLV